MVILAEELLLLGLDKQTGRHNTRYLKEAMAAALLVDLLQAGRIAVRNKRIIVTDSTPVGHPALDQLSRTINNQKWDLKPRSHVANTRSGLKERIADGLVEQQVLRADGERKRARGYRIIRPETETEVRGRLESLVGSQSPWDTRTAALGGLVYSGRMENLALPRHPRGQVRPILKTAARGNWQPGPSDPVALSLLLKGVMAAAVMGAQGSGNGAAGDGV